MALMVLLLGGCAAGGIVVSRTREIPEAVAQNPKELEKKIALLKSGMALEDVLKALNIKITAGGIQSPGVKFVTQAKEKQEIIYGNAMLQAQSLEDMEKFRKELDRYQVLQIKLSDTLKSYGLQAWPPALIATEVGPEIKTRLIHYDNRYVRAEPDEKYKKEITANYITSFIGNLLGIGASQGVKHIPK